MNATDSTTQHTIVFIHGMWMTPLSWERWSDRYTARGHRVLAPRGPASTPSPRSCVAIRRR